MFQKNVRNAPFLALFSYCHCSALTLYTRSKHARRVRLPACKPSHAQANESAHATVTGSHATIASSFSLPPIFSHHARRRDCSPFDYFTSIRAPVVAVERESVPSPGKLSTTMRLLSVWAGRWKRKQQRSGGFAETAFMVSSVDEGWKKIPGPGSITHISRLVCPVLGDASGSVSLPSQGVLVAHIWVLVAAAFRVVIIGRCLVARTLA